jgi:hypothetical protein
MGTPDSYGAAACEPMGAIELPDVEMTEAELQDWTRRFSQRPA